MPVGDAQDDLAALVPLDRIVGRSIEAGNRAARQRERDPVGDVARVVGDAPPRARRARDNVVAAAERERMAVEARGARAGPVEAHEVVRNLRDGRRLVRDQDVGRGVHAVALEEA